MSCFFQSTVSAGVVVAVCVDVCAGVCVDISGQCNAQSKAGANDCNWICQGVRVLTVECLGSLQSGLYRTFVGVNLEFK